MHHYHHITPHHHWGGNSWGGDGWGHSSWGGGKKDAIFSMLDSLMSHW